MVADGTAGSSGGRSNQATADLPQKHWTLGMPQILASDRQPAHDKWRPDFLGRACVDGASPAHAGMTYRASITFEFERDQVRRSLRARSPAHLKAGGLEQRARPPCPPRRPSRCDSRDIPSCARLLQ